MRSANLERLTKETQIRVRLNLDGTGKAALKTGLPFLEHMLDQVARHGMVDLEVQARGGGADGLLQLEELGAGPAELEGDAPERIARDNELHADPDHQALV